MDENCIELLWNIHELIKMLMKENFCSDMERKQKKEER
jgi:hypothetical protein